MDTTLFLIITGLALIVLATFVGGPLMAVTSLWQGWRGLRGFRKLCERLHGTPTNRTHQHTVTVGGRQALLTLVTESTILTNGHNDRFATGAENLPRVRT